MGDVSPVIKGLPDYWKGETQWTSYVLASASDRMHCFQASGADAGKLVWQSDEIFPSTSPAVIAGKVYVVTKFGHMYLLDLKDGQTILDWTFNLEGEPGITLADADGLLAFNAGSTLYGFELVSQNLWDRDWMHAPAASAGRVYSAAYDGTLYALHLNGQTDWVGPDAHSFHRPVATDTALYASTGANIMCFSAWGQPLGETTTNVPAVLGGFAPGVGVVYADAYTFNPFTGLQQGWLFAFDLNGNTLWQVPPLDPSSSWVYTDPTLDGSRLYAASWGVDSSYRVYAVNVTNGLLAWESEVPVGSPGAPYTWLSEVVLECGGGPNLFVASGDGHLYAFSRANGALAWTAEINPLTTDFFQPNPTAWCYGSSWGGHKMPLAIDPLAQILPEWLYVAINKPYPPPGPELVTRLRPLVKGLSPAERARIRAQARAVTDYADSIEQALSDEESEPSKP